MYLWWRSTLVVAGEEVSCQVLPWGIWCISHFKHRLGCLLGLMLGTNLAMINTIGYDCIYSSTVNGGLGRCFIFSIPLWMLWRSLSILPYSCGSIHTLSPFNSTLFSVVNSSLVSQKWHAMWGTSLILSGQPFKVNLYMVLWIGSLSTAPLTTFNLSSVKYMLCIFWCNSIGMFSFHGGNWLRQSAKTITFPGLYCIV